MDGAAPLFLSSRSQKLADAVRHADGEPLPQRAIENAVGSRIFADAGAATDGAGEAGVQSLPRLGLPDEIPASVGDAGAALTPRVDVSSRTSPAGRGEPLGAVGSNVERNQAAHIVVPPAGAFSEWPSTTELAQRLARVEAELAAIRAALAQQLAPHPAIQAAASIPTASVLAPRGESTEA